MDINVTAPVNTLGYGVVGMNVVAGLDRLGHAPALFPLGEVEAPVEHHQMLERALGRRALFNARAPSLRVSIQSDLAHHVGRGPHCGLPIFELNRFNESERNHLGAQDLLFVPSQWARGVLVDNGIPAERIRIARFGVDPDVFRYSGAIAPGPTVFLNVGKWEVRKGHDVLAEAFNSAFTKRDDVRLVMLTPNPFYGADEAREWADVYRSSELGGKIEVIEERLPSQHDVSALMARADCGVFPFRAEGWNLDLAEMMAMGKNVIATHYSAPTEYLTPQNARLITIDGLADANDAKWFHGQGQWADLGDAQVEQLVAHLREVHRLKQSGALEPNTAGRDTMAGYTWDATARAIVDALK
jgi:glycosyltransferase involved in cell wall biosynthesis